MSILRYLIGALYGAWWSLQDANWRRSIGNVPESMAVATSQFPETIEPRGVYDWTGATDAWAVDLRLAREDLAATEGRELARVGGQLTYLQDTGEYPIVLVSIDKLPGTIRAAEAEAEAEALREPKSTLCVDELGEWDPATVDWSEPAMFYENATHAVADGSLTLPPVRVDVPMRYVAEAVLLGI